MGSNGSYLKKNGGRAMERAVALLFSFVFHIVLGLALLVITPLFRHQEEIPEIYQVRLFFPEEVKSPKKTHGTKATRQPKKKPKKKKKPSLPKKKALKSRPHKKKQRKKVKTIRKKKAHKKKSQGRPVKKVVSTKPKPVKKKPKKTDEERLLRERLAKLKKRVEEKKMEERLEKRLEEIKKKVKASSYTDQRITSRSSSRGAPGEDIVLRRYFTKIWEIIRSKWVLPQGVIEEKGLEAVVDITISRDGRILVKHFEKRSGEPLFDQSVERAMESVKRLPPIPKELGVDHLDIGVRFKPEE